MVFDIGITDPDPDPSKSRLFSRIHIRFMIYTYNSLGPKDWILPICLQSFKDQNFSHVSDLDPIWQQSSFLSFELTLIPTYTGSDMNVLNVEYRE